jgi:hypothetical protein
LALRLGIGALLLAALIAAFSLQQQPDPFTGDIPPDAFDAQTGARLTTVLASTYADRRAGSPGDAALAERIAELLRNAMPTADVRTDEFTAPTPDGERRLRNVSATLLGQPGPEIVVVAHRDALEPGSAAELSATGALLTLARTAGQSRFDRTIRFVSTSGASGGGLTGATRLARQLSEPVEAVLVLGDMSGGRDRPAEVVPWSNSRQAAPLRLQRTVEQALRTEALAPRGNTGLWTQLVHRGLPATVGEQGEINQAGKPAVLLSAGGTSRPPADAAVDPAGFSAYGRAALRSLRALDSPTASVGPQLSGFVVAGQVMPAWAMRILILAIVLPVLGGALIVLLTLRRDEHPLAAGAAWTAGCAIGPLVAGLLIIALGRVGAISPAVPAPFAGGAAPPTAWAWVLIAFLLILLIATIVVAGPRLTRDVAGRTRPSRISVAAGVFGLMAVVTLVLVAWNPPAGLLVLPALVAWPAAIAPVPVTSPLHRAGLALLGALLPVAALVTVVGGLDVPLAQVPWWLVLLIAGGHITPFSLLLSSLIAGALIATALTLLPPGATDGIERLRERYAERRRRRADLADEVLEPVPDDDVGPAPETRPDLV